MGNEFMDSRDNNFKYNPDNSKNTALQNYILDFYRNKYKFTGIYDGPKFDKGKNPNEMIAPMLADNKDYIRNDRVDDGQYSKRRSCCLGKHLIPLSLPSYDPENKKVVTSTLDFPMFNTIPELKDPKNCTFENNINWQPNEKDGRGKPVASSQCGTFYDDLCNEVFENRKKNYTLSAVYNGPYNNNPMAKSANKFSVINPFSDCNCLNSAFNRGAKVAGDSGTPDEYAQTVDANCSSGMADNTVFYKSDVKKDMLCVNSIDLNGAKITAANNATIKIDQKSNCSSNTKKDSSADSVEVKAGSGEVNTVDNETPEQKAAKAAAQKAAADKAAADKAAADKAAADKAAADKAAADKAAADKAAASGSSGGSSGG
jgi:hypothetical protein